MICLVAVACNLLIMWWYAHGFVSAHAPTREEFAAAFRGLEENMIERLEAMNQNQRAMDDRLDLLKQQLEPTIDGWRASITKKLEECCPVRGPRR